MKLKLLRLLIKTSKHIEKPFLFLLMLVIIWTFCFPRITSLAQEIAAEAEATANEQIEAENPLAGIGEPLRILTVPVTAYNSLAAQTDSTPCFTANGFDLCKNNTQNVIAANFLKFGTKVRFPDFDPNTIYTVQDRMNARYNYRADIWMKTRPEALNFGIRSLKMEIYQ